MPQFGRPVANITQTNFTGGFAEIDEVSPSDADFAWSANNTTAELEVQLSILHDSGLNTGHVFRYRIARTNNGVVDGGGSASTVTARLMQGATQIATDTTKTADGTWTTYAFSLSTAEAGAISNYADLRLEFAVVGGGGSPAARRGAAISWAELETPDLFLTANAIVRKPQAGAFTVDAVIRAIGNLTVDAIIRKTQSPQGEAPDGTWTLNDQGSQNFRGPIAYGNGWWVVAGQTPSAIYYATDPTGTWTQNAFGTGLTAVAFLNGYFYAVGGTASSPAKTEIWRTTDPSGTWTQVLDVNSGPTERLLSIAWNGSTSGPVYVAAGANLSDTGVALYTSTNGTTWTQNTGHGITQTSLDGFRHLVYGNGYWVGSIGNTGAIYYASDPTGTWTQNTDASAFVNGLTFANGYFVGVGSSVIRYATDPTGAWDDDGQTPGSTLGIQVQDRQFAFGNGYWVKVSTSASQAFYKAGTPAGSWTSFNPGQDLDSVEYGPGRFVATQGGGTGVIRYRTVAQAGITFDAVIAQGPTHTGSFTADAVLRREQAGSFSVDAAIAILRSGSLTVDAVVWRSTQAGLTADAVLRREQVSSFTADAVLTAGGTVEASFTADAVIWMSQAFGLTADATLLRGQQASLLADAILRQERAGSLTADAHLIIRQVSSLTADAVTKRNQTGSIVARAWIRVPGETGVHIRVGGADITNDVIFADATFTVLVNGAPGAFSFRVRDDDHSHDFVEGAEVTLDINGVRRFGGFLTSVSRGFFFDVDGTTIPSIVSRVLTLQGFDYNLLFAKRVVYDKARPANVLLRKWTAGSDDDDVIRYVIDHYTDLFDDGITTDKVEHIGSPNPDMAGVVGSGGLYVGDIMREINRLIGGIWYISPDKDLTYTDVDTPTASKGLSDRPTTGETGYREFGMVEAGQKLANDALVWGAALGAAGMVFARAQDAASITAHGRWQYGEFVTHIYKQASANTRASSIVNGTPQNKRGGKDDQVSWTVSTFDPAFVIGQKVAIESEVWGVSDVVPIRRMTITFPTKDHPRFDMVLSHEIDEPWNIFEFFFPGFKFPPIGEIDIPPIGDPWPPFGCWSEEYAGLLDDFNRAVLSPDPASPLSNVGCTSYRNYTWLDDGFNASLTTVLDGGLRTTLPGPDYDPVQGTGVTSGAAQHRIFLPLDAKSIRVSFNLELSMNAYDPWTVGGGPSWSQCNFSVWRYDANGAFNPSTSARIQQYDVSIRIKQDRFTGSPLGTPHLYVEYSFQKADGTYTSGSQDLGAVGSISSFVSVTRGVIFEVNGTAVKLTVGSTVISETITSVATSPGEGYAKLILDTDSLNGEEVVEQTAPNSGFVQRISNLRVASNEGTCVLVPPNAEWPYDSYNGSCGG